MVICKDCGQLYKQSIKSKKEKHTGLCGLKAHTGRRDIEEERECADFTNEVVDDLFR